MPLCTVYPPSRYPLAFHRAVEAAMAQEGELVDAWVAKDRAEANRVMMRLRAFAKSFEVFPGFAPAVTERLQTHMLALRTERVEGSDVVVVRLKIAEDTRKTVVSLLGPMLC